MKSVRIGVYPGSFDPITYGHMDVVERSFMFLDRVVIAVADNPEKAYLFSLAERVSLTKAVFKNRKEIMVDSFAGLLVDYLKK
jgi:pantetheine-phosphate adenylyltransferase